jgi:hypothetical protein
MTDPEKIKAKIRKLLALSGSPNPNEAAASLEMAQKLMAEYRISGNEINRLDIGEEAARTTRRDNPPKYESYLIFCIANAFGCEYLYRHGAGGCSWRFVGLSHRVRVAAFLGTVLLRRLRKARAEYIKTLYRVRSRYRKTQRADDFCTSWVLAVVQKLSAFTGRSPEEKKETALYIQKNHPELAGAKPLDRSFGNINDLLNGRMAGGEVELRHGVGTGTGASALIGGAT